MRSVKKPTYFFQVWSMIKVRRNPDVGISKQAAEKVD